MCNFRHWWTVFGFTIFPDWLIVLFLSFESYNIIFCIIMYQNKRLSTFWLISLHKWTFPLVFGLGISLLIKAGIFKCLFLVLISLIKFLFFNVALSWDLLLVFSLFICQIHFFICIISFQRFIHDRIFADSWSNLESINSYY